MVSSLFNAADSKIGELKAAFQHLNECFNQGVNVQTWVIVSHLSDDLSNHFVTVQHLGDKISRFSYFDL